MERIKPGPGQESVWDYPRPPRLEDCSRRIRIDFGGITIVDTDQSKRVLETSHPPTYYLPATPPLLQYLVPTDRISMCEWKGVARYYNLVVDGRSVEHAAWSYDQPRAAFAAIQHHVAFYPQLMDACYVDGEAVQAQLGGFYGGWVTSDIVGPFKGGPGTLGW